MKSIARRLTALTASTLAATALAVASAPAPASAQPSLGQMGLSCGNGYLTTTAPSGTANQNFVNSGTADATWFIGVYHWNGQSWDFAWAPQHYVATVASNDGPAIGGTRGYLSAWRPANGGAYSHVASVSAIRGHYYAVVSAVYDSDRQITWQWSVPAGGRGYCQA